MVSSIWFNLDTEAVMECFFPHKIFLFSFLYSWKQRPISRTRICVFTPYNTLSDTKNPQSTLDRLSHVCNKKIKEKSVVKLWPLGLKFPVNNRASLTDQIETKHSFFAIMKWFLSQAICMYVDLTSLTKLIKKFDVTKLISTESKFCCYSLWITKVWWMSRSFSTSMKNSKFWVTLHVYTVNPAKHVRWVMDLPMASLNLYAPGSY